MAIKRELLANRASLAAFLQENAVPSIFGSVTYENDTIECYDDGNNLVLKIDDRGQIYAYRAEGNAISETNSTYDLIGTNPISIIACEKGFILENDYYPVTSGTNGKVAMLVAKTNNGEPAAIFKAMQNSKVTQYYTGIKHVAFGDSATLATTTTFTPEAGQQTMLVPFATNADIGDVSYTPDAFYMPMNSAYGFGIGKFSIGDDVFITNGYWAIKNS